MLENVITIYDTLIMRKYPLELLAFAIYINKK